MMKLQFAALLNNPHTKWAGIVYAATKLGLRISEIWFQNYSVNLRLTADAIESFAVLYGLAAAGAGNPPLKDTADELAMRKAQEKVDGAINAPKV